MRHDCLLSVAPPASVHACESGNAEFAGVDNAGEVKSALRVV